MKQYGANKATEFNKKQINVIYGMAKRGEVKIEKWAISEMYDLADYYGYDSNGGIEQYEREILLLLEAVFNNNIAEAQERIDDYTKHSFERKTVKYQGKLNRAIIA